MRERKQKSPEQRRADILSASEQLFLEKGVSATRIEDIANAADIGKGTLYLYFKNKDDILLGLGNAFLDYFIERIEHHTKQCQGDDLSAQIDAWLQGCLDAFYDKSELHSLVFHQANNQPIEHKHTNPAVKALELILDSNHQADSAFCAAIAFNIVHGGVEYAFAQTPVLARDVLFQKLSVTVKKSI